MLNLFDLEVIDAITQSDSEWYDSNLEDVILEFHIEDHELKVYNEFFEERLRKQFGIHDYSHLILKVENDGTEFGLKIVDQTVWVAKEALIKR